MNIHATTFALPQAAYRYLKNTDFGMMLMIGTLLHIVILLAIYLWPGERVEEIPVRTLDIRLGSVDLTEAVAAAPTPQIAPPEPAPKPATKPKATIQKESFKPKPAQKLESKPKEKRIKVDAKATTQKQASQPPATAITPQPRQFVRATPTAASQPLVRETAQQIRARYTQKISTWMMQHRVYPEMAKQLGYHGKPVVRVRINRAGAVKYFAIDRSSGYQLIDQAAMDMVRRSNPFPAPPTNYPGGQLLEFLIPVAFETK